jgi:hypothetical protein
VVYLSRVGLQLDDWCCPVEQLTASVEDEVVVRGDFAPGNRKMRPELVRSQTTELIPPKTSFNLRFIPKQEVIRKVLCGQARGSGKRDARDRERCPFVDLPEKRRGRYGEGVTLAEMKRCHWVKPILVCQVKFAEWTRDDRLRQPVFLGLREDKDAKEVVREKAI